MDRRKLLSAGAAGGTGLLSAAVLQSAGLAADHREPPVIVGRTVHSVGPVLTAGVSEILIGLLLPAVQKVRDPARLLLVAGDGSVLIQVPLQQAARSPAPFQSHYLTLARAVDESGKEGWAVTYGDEKVFHGPVPGNNIIAILIGLVTAGGSLGPVSGSLQFAMGDGSVRTILPFIEQENLYKQ